LSEIIFTKIDADGSDLRQTISSTKRAASLDPNTSSAPDGQDSEPEEAPLQHCSKAEPTTAIKEASLPARWGMTVAIAPIRFVPRIVAARPVEGTFRGD
jgi:hypothetical protein